MIYLCTNKDHKWIDDIDYFITTFGLLKTCSICGLKTMRIKLGDHYGYYVSDKSNTGLNCNEIIMKDILK